MISMKKAAIAAVLLSASVQASQVYYGLGAGFSQNNSSFNQTLTPGAGSQTAANSASMISGGEALKGFGFVGISGSLSELLRGSIQLDAGFDGLNKDVGLVTVSDGELTTNLQSGFYYGASARLSVIRGDFAPYALAGVRAGQWSLNVQNTSAQAISFIPAGTDTTVSGTLVAPELGVGLNVTYTDEWDGRMEYKYMFGSTKSNFSTNTTTGDQTEISLSPRQQSLEFSLVF